MDEYRLEPTMIRVGGAEMNGNPITRVTISILQREGQNKSDIDRVTTSYIHAQEMHKVLKEIIEQLDDCGGPGDALNHDTFEEALLLLQDMEDYW